MKGANSIEYANTLSNIGLVYFNKNKTNQALEYYNRALAIYHKTDDGRDSIECAKNLQKLGYA